MIAGWKEGDSEESRTPAKPGNGRNFIIVRPAGFEGSSYALLKFINIRTEMNRVVYYRWSFYENGKRREFQRVKSWIDSSW